MKTQEVTTKEIDFVVEPPNVEHLLTEDDTPVDNIFSEKQQRLLVDTLQTTKPFGDRPYVASTNVGLYYGVHLPAVVPDMLLSMDISYPPDVWEKRHRVYMIWELGKAPEVVVEVVSNTVGNEKGKKFDIYAKIGVLYYVIIDPLCFLHKQVINVYELRVGAYYPKETNLLDTIGIEAVLWHGEYENLEEDWLRWKDKNGVLLPTGVEAYQTETQRTAMEKQRAETEKQRADKLAEKLRELGINPDSV
jgi:Uma2 family endonuclease